MIVNLNNMSHVLSENAAQGVLACMHVHSEDTIYSAGLSGCRTHWNWFYSVSVSAFYIGLVCWIDWRINISNLGFKLEPGYIQ